MPLLAQEIPLRDTDIFVLTETFLYNNIKNSELSLNNFDIYRKDRSSYSSDKKRGGGCAVFAKKSLKSCEIPTASNDVEQVFIKFSF